MLFLNGTTSTITVHFLRAKINKLSHYSDLHRRNVEPDGSYYGRAKNHLSYRATTTKTSPFKSTSYTANFLFFVFSCFLFPSLLIRGNLATNRLTFSIKNRHVIRDQSRFSLDTDEKRRSASSRNAFAWEMLALEAQSECAFLKQYINIYMAFQPKLT